MHSTLNGFEVAEHIVSRVLGPLDDTLDEKD